MASEHDDDWSPAPAPEPVVLELRLEARFFHDRNGLRCAARWWRNSNVLHLSTLARPADRAAALEQVVASLKGGQHG